MLNFLNLQPRKLCLPLSTLVGCFSWATSWENLFMPYANNKATDQPAHSHSLISAFVVRCLYSIIPLLAIAEIPRSLHHEGNSYPKRQNFQFTTNNHSGFFFLLTLPSTIAFKLECTLFDQFYPKIFNQEMFGSAPIYDMDTFGGKWCQLNTAIKMLKMKLGSKYNLFDTPSILQYKQIYWSKYLQSVEFFLQSMH